MPYKMYRNDGKNYVTSKETVNFMAEPFWCDLELG
jgi:hypothetical protein